MTSNMIYIVALGDGMKCPRKIHLNTQCPPAPRFSELPPALLLIFLIEHASQEINFAGVRTPTPLLASPFAVCNFENIQLWNF